MTTLPRAANRHPDEFAPADTAEDARAWARRLARYRVASMERGLFELAVTAGSFALAWALLLIALHVGQFWLYALLLLPAGGLLMRLFMIQHDCGHGSFLPRRWCNDWTGRVIGVLTLTPYDYWRHSHAIHHAASGNLDRRGIGDVTTLTVKEYRESSSWQRLRYRLYRHPLVMFGIGPIYLFVLQHRLPLGRMRHGWTPWISTMATNAVILGLAGLLIGFFEIGPFLLVHLPLVLLAATAGVWLFYVQHQYDTTHWERSDTWNAHAAALHGSSHYDLPAVLRWFTANIGVHHVHHLASRIPFYRLGDVLKDHPELRAIGRLTLRDSLRCVQLVLWDEEQRRLVSFKEAGTSLAAPVLQSGS